MKKKKPMCTVLVAMLILSITIVATRVDADTQLPKLSVDPETYTATQLGEVFTININVTNITNLIRFEFKLGYNTTLLDALDAVEGPLPQQPISRLMEVRDSEGYIWVSISCSQTEGNGTLVIVTFNATSAESASCALHLYDTELLDTSADPILHEVEDGEYDFAILNLTVTTDKQFYYFKENVTIYGNLTLNNMSHQALVALEVDDPVTVVITRTLQTGPTPPPGKITIVEVFSCNNRGQPKDAFTKRELAYFYVAVRNNGTEYKNVTITINAFDVSMVPLPGVPWTKIPVGPNSQSDFLAGIYIPSWADTGNGTVYACALTDMPKQGGIPYCPEASATFQITEGYGGTIGTGTMGEQSSENIGNYSLTFKLPRTDVHAGNWTAHVSVAYRGTTTSTQATSNTTFETWLLGDINGDGKITGGDIGKMDLIYSRSITDPILVARADINGDGKITGGDVGKLDLIYSGFL